MKASLTAPGGDPVLRVEDARRGPPERRPGAGTGKDPPAAKRHHHCEAASPRPAGAGSPPLSPRHRRASEFRGRFITAVPAKRTPPLSAVPDGTGRTVANPSLKTVPATTPMLQKPQLIWQSEGMEWEFSREAVIDLALFLGLLGAVATLGLSGIWMALNRRR